MTRTALMTIGAASLAVALALPAQAQPAPQQNQGDNKAGNDKPANQQK